MKAVIQRVKFCEVKVNDAIVGKIKNGLLILLGITHDDTDEDIQWLTQKIVNLRIFNDEAGVMNVSVKDANGEILVVSQFTLHAATKKGNRPSYIAAARPEMAVPLYEKFLKEVELQLGKKVEAGIFGADMQVSLLNDGPVTIIIDTKEKV
ncbi:MAG: D-aminoacyl-tRNA deacylase [Cyclobacteriaceae bacterium]|jgi:D-tyrosyl-tRNA(Tyr) deacylase|nr:D-aminoacyl-tRNA deacylase [Flammeovirgaceae bacterium]MCZ8023409.1 D-aminoacyl-tRNA deacylase [Cytophagales bacterium]MCZ8329158.1 D-aminoacyl-tRNA deacylase [Cyclobacteriaceae bacterium]